MDSKSQSPRTDSQCALAQLLQLAHVCVQTDWSALRTMRDRIRNKYRLLGQEYEWPDRFAAPAHTICSYGHGLSVNSPAALGMVRPLHTNDEPLRWWKPRRGQRQSVAPQPKIP